MHTSSSFSVSLRKPETNFLTSLRYKGIAFIRFQACRWLYLCFLNITITHNDLSPPQKRKLPTKTKQKKMTTKEKPKSQTQTQSSFRTILHGNRGVCVCVCILDWRLKFSYKLMTQRTGIFKMISKSFMGASHLSLGSNWGHLWNHSNVNFSKRNE